HEPDVPLLDEVEEPEAAVRVALRDRDDEAEVRFDEALLSVLRLQLARANHPQRVAQHLGGHADLAQDLLRLAAGLADRIGSLHDLRGGSAEEAARRAGRVLLLGPDACGVLEDLRGGMAEPLLETPDLVLVGVDEALRLLQLV